MYIFTRDRVLSHYYSVKAVFFSPLSLRYYRLVRFPHIPTVAAETTKRGSRQLHSSRGVRSFAARSGITLGRDACYPRGTPTEAPSSNGRPCSTIIVGTASLVPRSAVHFIPYRREGGATAVPKVPTATAAVAARGKTMMVMAENIKAQAGEDHNRFFACVILSV